MQRRRLALSLAFVLLATSAFAQEALPGTEIAALVGDHTVQGSMNSSGAYAEFYDADGTIRGDGYTGVWTVEGDAMCFQYGEDPAICFQVAKEGAELMWLLDGEVQGTGTLVDGNPNKF